MLIEGIKFSCAACIKGHRQANCNHGDRELFEVKKRGRPISSCETCRTIRKESNSHKTCTHCVVDRESNPFSISVPRYADITSEQVIEPDLVRSLPNGAADTASMALVRRASSVRSRSSASSANHPPLPGSTSNDTSQEEDLATVGRKKSVSKSRRKDSKTAKDPHDLSHGHSAHHPTHHSSQFSPYPATHQHPHPPLPRNGSSSGDASLLSPQPISNSDLASAFFFRDFEKLEATSSASSSGPGRPDSAVSTSAASYSSEGGDSPEFKEPIRRPSIQKEHQPLPPPVAMRPVKERKRSGLAQMYGAEEAEEEEEEGGEKEMERRESETRQAETNNNSSIPPLPAYPQSFNDFANSMNSTVDNCNDYANFAPQQTDPSSSSFSLPSCDYAIPRAYAPPMAEYSSTAPSAYSAYSGYTPPLERTTSYSVEEEEDPLGALSELQPQQTDLDILEWISTIAPLPPSSTPASTGESSLPSSTVPSFEFQPTEWTVSTPTSYPEPPPSSVGIASSDFAGLVLSPTGEFDSSTKSFPLPLPSDSSSFPPPSSSSSTSHSFSQSQSQSQSQSHDQDASFYFPDFTRNQQQPLNLPPSFDSGDIHLERYGIDESYFARLGSFEPTATPTSTPVHDAMAGWEKRIEQTKGLMLQEFGEKLEQQRQGGEVYQGEEGLESWGWDLNKQQQQEEVREFATGSRGRVSADQTNSNDSGSRERCQAVAGTTELQGEGENWWLKLNS
ncbi:hypothetical protein JCM5350_006096 [Sporobolomyces pararoseus]